MLKKYKWLLHQHYYDSNSDCDWYKRHEKEYGFNKTLTQMTAVTISEAFVRIGFGGKLWNHWQCLLRGGLSWTSLILRWICYSLMTRCNRVVWTGQPHLGVDRQKSNHRNDRDPFLMKPRIVMICIFSALKPSNIPRANRISLKDRIIWQMFPINLANAFD